MIPGVRIYADQQLLHGWGEWDADDAWPSATPPATPPLTPRPLPRPRDSPKSSTPQPKKVVKQPLPKKVDGEKAGGDEYPSEAEKVRLQNWWCKYKKPKDENATSLKISTRAMSEFA